MEQQDMAIEVAKEYIQVMQVDVSEKDGVVQQANLYHAYYMIFNDDAYFHPRLKALMKLITANSTEIDEPFNDYMVFRFMKNVALPSSQLREFEELTMLFLILGNPVTRHLNRSRVDMKKALANVRTEEIRQKLIQFFT